MRDVSPGRDMVLCRLKGCNLEHAGIIQGMSGSPIYIEGKLLGAVAFAWEFAKDPIAGITPFSADDPVRAVERSEDHGGIERSRMPGRFAHRRGHSSFRWSRGLDDDAAQGAGRGLRCRFPVSGGASRG